MRFGNVSPSSAVRYSFIEANDQKSMQADLNALFVALLAVEPAVAITAIDLAAAGFGPAFMCVVEYAPASATSGGLLPAAQPVSQVFLGSTANALGANALALPAIPDQQLVGELYAGGSQGNVFMGIRILQTEDFPSGFGTPFGLMAGDALNNVLAPGTNVLIGSPGAGLTLSDGANFEVNTAGILEYTGALPFFAQFEAQITATLAVALSAKLDIVRDPAGTPDTIGTGSSFTTVANLAYTAHTMAAGGSVAPGDTFGLQISGIGGGGSGTLLGAQLLITPI